MFSGLVTIILNILLLILSEKTRIFVLFNKTFVHLAFLKFLWVGLASAASGCLHFSYILF